MTVRKPHTIQEFSDQQLHALDDNVTRLYSHKIESKYKYEGSASSVVSYLYQSIEHGQFTVSANGSATVVRSIGFGENRDKIMGVCAHAVSPLITAHITDVTASSITLEMRPISGTANFSAVTTASITVFYRVTSGET